MRENTEDTELNIFDVPLLPVGTVGAAIALLLMSREYYNSAVRGEVQGLPIQTVLFTISLLFIGVGGISTIYRSRSLQEEEMPPVQQPVLIAQQGQEEVGVKLVPVSEKIFSCAAPAA